VNADIPEASRSTRTQGCNGADGPVKPFETPSKTLGDLKADAAARILAASADVALIVDRKGVIKDVMCSSKGMSENGCTNWVGKAWVDTVTVESRVKVEELLASAAAKEEPRWRQVNHPTSRGDDIPVRYSTIQFGSPSRVIAIGQDLRHQARQQQRLVEAQATMEREYARLRHAELRYRALFQVSGEAVLILDAAAQGLVEANPAATQLLANGSKRTVGRTFSELFDEDSAGAAADLLASAQSMPRVDGIQVTSAHGKRKFLLSASIFRQDAIAHFLVRLAPLSTEAEAVEVGRKSAILDMVEAMPDAFVVADKDRRIITANSAFLELCELAQVAQVRNESLDRWLGRVTVDIDVLAAHLREHGSIRRFATIARGEYGARDDIEISGVYVPSRDTPYFGLTIRRMEMRVDTPAQSQQALPRSVEQLTELVGRVPLKDLVRETTDIVERLCIEAALELTQDNRASAAEMLGLSRQSFYVKMRRHGLGELGGDGAE